MANQSLAHDLTESRLATDKARADALAAAAAATLAGPCRRRPAPSAAMAQRAPAGPLRRSTCSTGRRPSAARASNACAHSRRRSKAQGFKGRVRVESFVGDFCLTGNRGDGFRRGRVRHRGAEVRPRRQSVRRLAVRGPAPVGRLREFRRLAAQAHRRRDRGRDRERRTHASRSNTRRRTSARPQATGTWLPRRTTASNFTSCQALERCTADGADLARHAG